LIEIEQKSGEAAGGCSKLKILGRLNRADQAEKVVVVKFDGQLRRIGVVSDTHVPRRAGMLPREMLQGLEGVDLILHAGDLIHESVLYELQELAPVEAVAGNVDPPELHERLKRRKLIRAGDLTIGLIHGDGRGGKTLKRAEEAFKGLGTQVIVFGHSHQPLCEYSDDILMFNPGSCIDPRWAGRPSYGMLNCNHSSVFGEIIYL
jgi:putative phosphoesterase